MTAAERALEFVKDGQTLGLGTGRAAADFVRALGARMKDGGLRVKGVPTSLATEALVDADYLDALKSALRGADG